MKVYLVGGAVRDSLLNLPIKDRDWVVVGGTKEILLKKKFQQVGKDFPVFLHPETHEEYALARKERKSGRGYTGFHTEFDSDVTLEEDLIRRDLTINAIAKDKYGNYIDPFQGKKDLELRLLRHISDSFMEDPLRVLRTARFAASLVHLGFHIDNKTMILMSKMVKKNELLYLTKNRIWNETEKAFKTSNPHVYFQVLHACQALYSIFPEIFFLYERKRFSSPLFKNLYNSCFLSMGLSKIRILTKDISIQFSYLCQFLPQKTEFSSTKKNYDEYAAALVKRLCNRFNVPLNIRELAVLNAGFYVFLNSIHHQSSKNIIDMFSKIDAWRKPDRIYKLSFLSDFNLFHHNQNKTFNFKLKTGFLKKCFFIIKDISVKTILNRGFKGYKIRNELNKLRVKKLELWRMKKNIFFKK
ncbi:tRNA CCA-pyrophosphorylase [Buchnera aphidicola (Rhopalosiphum padi)]|uniref:CCA-adding enzyme n=1 Tax=Buchnera aphidicola subsp. Rhopalosiphum padi TaxID=98793 RepID=A0A4D6YDI1_BUCRP|nr:tRNA CCA-pyrophosphorylase [Buchnera aphidicola]QCI24721.1 tRNA CCA-pyrophosphorylase [Buchnera aphidicola (Rhopalosiphum padi)]